MEEEFLRAIARAPIRTSKLKALMLRAKLCRNVRTADRLVEKWIDNGLIKKISLERKDFRVIHSEFYNEYEKDRWEKIKVLVN
jgi:hypothetical protein